LPGRRRRHSFFSPDGRQQQHDSWPSPVRHPQWGLLATTPSIGPRRLPSHRQTAAHYRSRKSFLRLLLLRLRACLHTLTRNCTTSPMLAPGSPRSDISAVSLLDVEADCCPIRQPSQPVLANPSCRKVDIDLPANQPPERGTWNKNVVTVRRWRRLQDQGKCKGRCVVSTSRTAKHNRGAVDGCPAGVEPTCLRSDFLVRGREQPNTTLSVNGPARFRSVIIHSARYRPASTATRIRPSFDVQVKTARRFISGAR